jgi:DNA-binding Lrp family transcriptional regulator
LVDHPTGLSPIGIATSIFRLPGRVIIITIFAAICQAFGSICLLIRLVRILACLVLGPISLFPEMPLYVSKSGHWIDVFNNATFRSGVLPLASGGSGRGHGIAFFRCILYHANPKNGRRLFREDKRLRAKGGIMAQAYVLLKVTPGYERNIVKTLKDIPEIEEISELYGEWDIIIKASVARIEDLDGLLSEKMRKIEGVTLTSTMIVAAYKY